MRQLVIFSAALLSLTAFGLLASLGQAEVQIAQKEPAAEEKKQDASKEEAAKASDEEKKKQVQDEYEKFAKQFFPELKEMLSQAQEGKHVDFAPLVKRYSERLATKANADEVGDGLKVADYLEKLAPPEHAKSIYVAINKLADRIEPSDAKLAGQLREHLKRPLTLLNMVGTKPAIEGTQVDGEKFDWSKYKGKVVLLDFWATWCGPCVAEIPNVKKAYEKYHEKGFDVVGISLDDDVKKLIAFQEKEKLPWVTLFPTGADRGFDAPLAKQFLIEGIPSTFLIDREGKLVSIFARGPRLEAQLEKLLEKK